MRFHPKTRSAVVHLNSGRGRRGLARSQNASAVLIVLVFLFAMTLIVLANSTTLYWVKQEILRIDQRQQKTAALDATNAAPGIPGKPGAEIKRP